MYKLYFANAVSQSGFTNLSSSFVNDKNGSLIIRELLQNAYDSAIEEAKRKTAVVKFYIEKVKKDQIPSIKEYQDAVFNIEQNEKLSEQERDILNAIKEELNKDEIWAFYVIDNGIGFDRKRLTAILSDGISEKLDPSNASGSYGNGHFSVFSSSNLRYVLYAGKHNGKSLCSGEAMLRTFKKDGKLKSQNGFLLKHNLPIIEENDVFVDYNIPEILADKLDDVQEGAVICSLGFNFFDSQKDIVNMILSTVSRNFFISVLNNQLEIEIHYENNIYQLNKKNIEEVFYSTKDEKLYPKFNIVERFFDTFVNGNKEIVKTQAGEIEIIFQESGEFKIALCRNGMWINDSMPSPLNKASFVEYKPYSVLLLPKKNTQLATLIRRAEGNLHRDIKYNRFSDDKNGREKREKLKNALNEIRQYLYKKLKRFSTDEFSVEIPQLSVPMIGDSVSKKPQKRVSKNTKKITPVILSQNEGEEIEVKHKNKKSKEKIRLNKTVNINKFWALHKAEKKMAKVKFVSDAEKNIALILRIDNGKDPTCEGFGIMNGEKIKIKKVLKNGAECEIINGEIIDLGKILKDEEVNLEIFYKTDYKGDFTIDYEFISATRQSNE